MKGIFQKIQNQLNGGFQTSDIYLGGDSALPMQNNK